MLPEDDPQATGTPDSPPQTPAGAEVPIGPTPTRLENGTFAPGNKLGGRRQGALDRVARAMKDAYEAFMEGQMDKDRYNPLIILATICGSTDPTDVEVRSMAAFRLWKMIVPKQLEITGKDGTPIEISDRVDFAKELAENPQIRAIIEAAQEKMGTKK